MSNHEQEALQLRARIFKALGHPTRLWIVELLTSGPLSVADIASELNEGFSAISQHLAMLRQYGIINDERRGRQVYYSIATPCILNLCAALAGDAMATLSDRPKQRRLPKLPSGVLSTILILSCSLSALLFSLTPYVIRRPSHFLPMPPPPPSFDHSTFVHHAKMAPYDKACRCHRAHAMKDAKNATDTISDINLCAN